MATCFSFFEDSQATKLADLIGKLKGQEPQGKMFQQATQLLEEQKHTDMLVNFAAESGVLLQVEDAAFESVYGLLIALIKDAHSQTVPKLVADILQPLADNPTIKFPYNLRVLTNLYNNLDVNSPQRYDVFTVIVNTAAKNKSLNVLQPYYNSLDQLLTQWNSTAEQRKQLYLSLYEASTDESDESSSGSLDMLVKYLSQYNEATSEELKQQSEMASTAIKAAIAHPQILTFENFLELKAIQELKDTKLYQLLHIFSEQTLAEYKSFETANPKFMAENGLDGEVTLKKIRYLTMTSLAAEHVNSHLPYSDIVKALDVPADEVEMWIIDIVSAGLIRAKMDQLNETLYISSATSRTMKEEQWEMLRDRLDQWKQGLSGMLQVIANAKLIAGSQDVATLPIATK